MATLTPADLAAVARSVVADLAPRRQARDAAREVSRGESGPKGDRGLRGDPGQQGEPGGIGPMPRHEWQGTKLRFEVSPDQWGAWVDLQGPPGTASFFGGATGAPGVGIAAAAFSPENHLLLTLTDGSAIDAGAFDLPFDDFSEVEYLDDQVSAGSVLTFTFATPVNKIWVEMLAANADDVTTARVRCDGVDPDADTGTLLHAGQVQPISFTTDAVKVLAPSGKTVCVYGYRR